MKKITIAFDVDGTLIRNDKAEWWIEPNERIRNLLVILSGFKNTYIVAWSGRGKEWAEEVCEKIWLEHYVDWYASKNHKGKDENGKHIFEPDFIPDIAIDDIQACELGKLNLIVKEK